MRSLRRETRPTTCLARLAAVKRGGGQTRFSTCLQVMLWTGVLVGLAGCPLIENGSNGSNHGRSEAINHKGRTLVAVLDRSASIKDTDREGYGGAGGLTRDGAQLAAALTATGQNFGAVSFNQSGEVLSGLGELRNKDSRIAARDDIRRLSFRGQTNFMSALEQARAMLDQVHGGRSKTVAFISDGEPTVGPEDIEEFREILAEFKERKWRIHTIGFSSEGQTDLIRQLATATGGAYYPVNHSRDLLLAFLQITRDAENLFITDRLKAVELFPGTRRLIYALIKLEPRTNFMQLTRDRQNVAYGSSPNIYYYPPRDMASKTNFEVIHIDNPETGVWDAEVAGRYEIAMTMAELPFDIEVHPEQPQSEYFNGDLVGLGLRATLGEGADDETLALLERGARVQVTVRAENGRSVEVECGSDGVVEDHLDFIGTTSDLRLRDPDVSEVFTADFRLVWTGDSGGSWEITKSVSFRMYPRPPAFITLDSSLLELGDRWVGEEVSGEITISTDRAAGVDIEPQVPEGFAVRPSSATVKPGMPMTFSIQVDSDKPGSFQNQVRFTAMHAGQSQDHGVMVRGRLFALKGSGDLGQAMVGAAAFSSVCSVQLLPSERFEIELNELSLDGGAVLRVEESKISDTERRITVVGGVPWGTAPGTYRGALRVRPMGGSSWGELPLSLVVVQPKPELVISGPALLRAGAAGGWVETTVDISSSFDRELPFSADKAELLSGGNRIPAGLNMELLSDDAGWTLEESATGVRGNLGRQTRRLKIRIRVKADIPDGTYTGEFELQVQGPEGPTTAKLPVTLEIER